MTYIKVKDKNYLERDVLSNAIVNTDLENYQRYVELYKEKYNEKQRLSKLEEDMSSLKNDLSEIKFLIQKLAEK